MHSDWIYDDEDSGVAKEGMKADNLIENNTEIVLLSKASEDAHVKVRRFKVSRNLKSLLLLANLRKQWSVNRLKLKPVILEKKCFRGV